MFNALFQESVQGLPLQERAELPLSICAYGALLALRNQAGPHQIVVPAK